MQKKKKEKKIYLGPQNFAIVMVTMFSFGKEISNVGDLMEN